MSNVLRGVPRALRIGSLVAVGFVAVSAEASVLNGRVSGTENWTISPGGGNLAWSWAADWDLNLTTSTMTIRQTVRLSPGALQTGASAAELANWESRIESAWNNGAMYVQCMDSSFNLGPTFNIRYDITLVTPGYTGGIDFDVTLYDGSGGTNAAEWYRTGGSGVNRADLNVAAHEIGHLLGNPDEYTDGGAIVAGSPFNAPSFTTTSLMNNTNATNAGTPVGRTQPRHYKAWEMAFASYNLHKGGTNLYFVIPTPSGLFVIGTAALAFARRRR